MKLCTYVYIHISLNVLGIKANNTENLYSNLYTLQRRSKKNKNRTGTKFVIKKYLPVPYSNTKQLQITITYHQYNSPLR